MNPKQNFPLPDFSTIFTCARPAVCRMCDLCDLIETLPTLLPNVLEARNSSVAQKNTIYGKKSMYGENPYKKFFPPI